MVMHVSTQFDSPPLGGTTTRAEAGFDDTAQPPLTSGFGAVMQQEEDIQSSTEGYLGADNGPNSAAIDRLLRQQGTRLGANLALLERRYGMLPHPARFRPLQAKHVRLSTARRAAAPDSGVLPSLIAQHLELLRKIETLISQRPDGQRGELILAQIARNHEEMAWMLAALIKQDECVRDLVPYPVTAAAPATSNLASGEANWENEGGAARVEPLER